MNNRLLSCAFLGALVFPLSAKADNLVQFPTGPAAWTVTIGPSQLPATGPVPKAPPPGSPGDETKIDVTQDAKKRLSVITWSNHTTTSRWEIPSANLFLYEDPIGQAGAVFSNSPITKNLAIPFTASCFSWLTPQSLVSTDPVNYQGKQCFHYKATVPATTFGPFGGKGTTSAEAYIDSTTLLPVALDDGTKQAIYTFSPTPPAPFSLPDKFKSAVSRFEQAIGIMTPTNL